MYIYIRFFTFSQTECEIMNYLFNCIRNLDLTDSKPSSIYQLETWHSSKMDPFYHHAMDNIWVNEWEWD